MTDQEPQSRGTSGTEATKFEFGVWPVLIGVAGLVLALGVIALRWRSETGVAALGVIASPIAAMVSAYFGIQYSQRAASDAAETKKEAEKRVEKAEEDKAKTVESIRQEVLPALKDAAHTQQMPLDQAEGFAARTWDNVRAKAG